MSLRQAVHRPAEGRVVLKEVNILPLGVQDVGGDACKDIEVGNQLQKPLFIEEYIQKCHLRNE